MTPQSKKILLTVIIFFTAVFLVYFKLQYFKSAEIKDKKNELEVIINETKKISQDLEKEYEEFKENMEIAKSALTSPEIDSGTEEDIRKFQEQILKKIDEKSLESVHQEIKNIKNEISRDWEVKISTIEKGKDDLMVAKMMLTSRDECFQCISELCPDGAQALPRKILEFYPIDKKEIIEEAVKKYNSKALEGICIKEKIYETANFLVLNGCINDEWCEDMKPLNIFINNYFTNIKKD